MVKQEGTLWKEKNRFEKGIFAAKMTMRVLMVIIAITTLIIARLTDQFYSQWGEVVMKVFGGLIIAIMIIQAIESFPYSKWMFVIDVIGILVLLTLTIVV